MSCIAALSQAGIAQHGLHYTIAIAKSGHAPQARGACGRGVLSRYYGLFSPLWAFRLCFGPD